MSAEAPTVEYALSSSLNELESHDVPIHSEYQVELEPHSGCNYTLPALSSMRGYALESTNVSEPKRDKRSMTEYEAQLFNAMRDSSMDALRAHCRIKNLSLEGSRKALIHRIIHNISYKQVENRQHLSKGGRGGGRGRSGRGGRRSKTLRKYQ